MKNQKRKKNQKKRRLRFKIKMTEIKKKCWPEWFEKFKSGERKFELRLADFDLKSGEL